MQTPTTISDALEKVKSAQVVSRPLDFDEVVPKVMPEEPESCHQEYNGTDSVSHIAVEYVDRRLSSCASFVDPDEELYAENNIVRQSCSRITEDFTEPQDKCKDKRKEECRATTACEGEQPKASLVLSSSSRVNGEPLNCNR